MEMTLFHIKYLIFLLLEFLLGIPNCSDVEIEEFFDFNLKDELKGIQLEKDDTEYSFKKKDSKLVIRKDGEHYKALKTFIVTIKNKAEEKKAMMVFVDTVNFDPACFKGAMNFCFHNAS